MYVCRFAHGGDTFPLGTTSLLEGSSGLQEAYTKAADTSSCCAASSPPTLLLAAQPRRYGQVIHTPPTPSSSFPVPHAPTDGATPSAEITVPLLQLSTAHSHFAHSIKWSSIASSSREANHGRMCARGRYGCHACRPPDLGGAPRLRGHHRHPPHGFLL